VWIKLVRFRARCFTYIHGAHLALVLICIPIPSQASDEDAKSLLSALASDGCESHVQAISRYSRSKDNEAGRNAALQQLSAAAIPPIRQQASSVLALMEDGRVGRTKILALTKRVTEFDKLSKDARGRALGQMRQELLRIIHDPKERIAARIGAPWLLARILRGSADHPEWKTEWAEALATMLRNADASLRVVGAATAALHRFPEGSDPIKADVIRPLINGLDADSVTVRAAAYLGLRQVLAGSPDVICFDSTATRDRRAAAIRQWDEWWDANRERLGRERVVQGLW
jgi:hypothetical protein